MTAQRTLEGQTFEYERGALDRDDPLHGELMELNMGPQHPARGP